MVADLVLQHAHEPAFLGAAAGELVRAPERGQKSFLNHVLGLRRVAQAQEGKLEEVVAMFLDPPFRIRQAHRSGVRRDRRGRSDGFSV